MTEEQFACYAFRSKEGKLFHPESMISWEKISLSSRVRLNESKVHILFNDIKRSVEMIQKDKEDERKNYSRSTKIAFNNWPLEIVKIKFGVISIEDAPELLL